MVVVVGGGGVLSCLADADLDPTSEGKVYNQSPGIPCFFFFAVFGQILTHNSTTSCGLLKTKCKNDLLCHDATTVRFSES